jgi:hypothetical protein
LDEVKGYVAARNPHVIRYGIFDKVYRSPAAHDSFLKKCWSRTRAKFEIAKL